MKAKKMILAAFAGTALLAAAGAQARDDHWRHGDRGYHHGYWGGGARVVVRPAYYGPRYYYDYAPRYYDPYYYAPAPVYYGPSAPVVYGQIPLGHRSSLGFSLPLY